MAIPETDLARVRRFCEVQVPAELRDQIRVECRVRGKAVTIVECRPPWHASDGEWDEIAQARMRYDDSTRGWTLYWFDRNGRGHVYPQVEPHQPIQRLLEEYERDPTGIFKG